MDIRNGVRVTTRRLAMRAEAFCRAQSPPITTRQQWRDLVLTWTTFSAWLPFLRALALNIVSFGETEGDPTDTD